MKRGPRSLRGRDAPAPTPCVPAECFDLLVRHCVACGLLRTPRPKPGKEDPPGARRRQPRGGRGPDRHGEGTAPTPGGAEG